MERLTSPNINVDPDTDRFLHAAIGGKEIDWKQFRDSTLNVMINGPTSNGFGKDIFRKMARDLYGRLKAYEDRGCEPEEVLPKDKADEIALKLMRLADLESICSYTRLRELAEDDKGGRVSVLPCKPGADMINKILPGSTYLMERVHFAVAYVNKGNIYLMTQRAFEEGVKNGTIVSAATERAMEGRKEG